MHSKEKNFVSVVIYIHNAADYIRQFLEMIISCMEENFEHSEIICVNDYSDDNSVEIIKNTCAELGKKSTSVSIVNLSCFHGIELAMNAGTDLAIGDFVFEFDYSISDFTSEAIMDVYYRSLDGFDIVSAVPNRKPRISSRIFYALFSHFSKNSYYMTTERFRILSRRVLNRIGAMNRTIPYRKAIYSNSGLKTDKLYYDVILEQNRKIENSSYKYRSDLAIDSFILFTDLGYRFGKNMSLFMIGLTCAVLIYTIAAYLLSNPVDGWTSTVLFLSVAFFGLFGILTIIIRYLQLILDLVFKRKQYSFESIEKISE